jgi:hypothetical protein
MDNCPKPYFRYSEQAKAYKFQVHLVNPTSADYKRVVKETGGYTFFDDELVSTNVFIKEMGSLPPNSTLLVDESDLGERDFTIWYRFDLYQGDEEKPVRITYRLVPFKQ